MAPLRRATTWPLLRRVPILYVNCIFSWRTKFTVVQGHVGDLVDILQEHGVFDEYMSRVDELALERLLTDAAITDAAPTDPIAAATASADNLGVWAYHVDRRVKAIL